MCLYMYVRVCVSLSLLCLYLFVRKELRTDDEKMGAELVFKSLLVWSLDFKMSFLEQRQVFMHICGNVLHFSLLARSDAYCPDVY